MTTAKHEARQASLRWCPSCQTIVYTEWGECKGHQGTTKESGSPWFGCRAVLDKAPVPVVYEEKTTPPPAGAMTRATLITVLNSVGLRPRMQKVNVVSAATPFGKREEVPHTTECPLCQARPAYGIYTTSYRSGRTELELACVDCAVAKIPFRRDLDGVVCVKHAVLWATIELVGQDAWKVNVVSSEGR